MHHDTGSAEAAAVVQELRRLPTVPTADWCDRAARCVALPLSRGVAVVIVVYRATSPGASPRTRTAGIGVAVRGAVEEGRIDTIRAQCRFAHPDSLVKEEAAAWSGVFRAPPCDPEPVTAVAWLHERGAGHAVVAGVCAPDAAQRELAAATLDAALPELTSRARLALGRGGPPAWLTLKEQEVLTHLVRGMSVRQIAEELGRSKHTIHGHVKSLHRKLGASTRGGLVARALGSAEMPEPLIPEVRPFTSLLAPQADRAGPAPAGPPGEGPA